MSDSFRIAGLTIAATLLLGGCGPSIWSLNNKEEVTEQFDGALVGYALASGVAGRNMLPKTRA
jgi:hypothetical protein